MERKIYTKPIVEPVEFEILEDVMDSIDPGVYGSTEVDPDW